MEKVKYLAKKLKTFTFNEMLILSEIEYKALQIILDELVKEMYLKQDSQGYVLIGKIPEHKTKPIPKVKTNSSNYGIFVCNTTKVKNISFLNAVNQFLAEYVTKFCTASTLRTYKSLFKNNILPYFKNKNFEDINTEDIIGFYECCMQKNMSAKRIKNALALLKQFMQYAKDNGFTATICQFQVKRLSAKNEFNLNRIVFENGVSTCF